MPESDAASTGAGISNSQTMSMGGADSAGHNSRYPPVEKLDNTNYRVWAFHMESAFMKSGAWPLINGTDSRPASGTEEQAAWDSGLGQKGYDGSC